MQSCTSSGPPRLAPARQGQSLPFLFRIGPFQGPWTPSWRVGEGAGGESASLSQIRPRFSRAQNESDTHHPPCLVYSSRIGQPVVCLLHALSLLCFFFSSKNYFFFFFFSFSLELCMSFVH